MKIIHLISGGDVGGAKTHVLSLLQGLGRTQTVRLICFTEGPFAQEARALGIDTQVLAAGVGESLRTLAATIRAEGFEIVHCHGARANMMGAILRRMVDVPTVTTVHSDYRRDYIGRPLSRLSYGTINTVALRLLDYHIGVSDAMTQMLILRGFAPQRLFTIYNGVDFPPAPCALSRAELLQRAGVQADGDSVIFGIAARLNPIKDIATLIRGFARAVQTRPGLRLLIGGDGEERQMLEALARELCPAGTVAFLGWVQDTASFFGAIDVNVLSSLSEGFPYVIPEGARMRCATIATRVGGIPYIIEHGVTGLLFTPRDDAALGELMGRVADDAAFRRQLAENLYEKAAAEFSTSATVGKQLEIYRTILRRRERPRKQRDGVMICGAYGKGNAGDDAILKAVAAQMQAIDPDMPIRVLSHNPKQTRMKYEVDACHIFNPFGFLPRMRRTELYLSGGGSLIQNETSTRSLYYYLLSIRLAKRLGCKVLMYGCGIGPVSGAHCRSAAARTINRFVDRITVREPMSAQELASMGVTEPPVTVTADPALLLTPQSEGSVDGYLLSQGLDPNGAYALFCLRPWKGYSERAQAFVEAAQMLRSEYGLTPLFFALEPGRDLAPCRAAAEQLGGGSAALSAPEDVRLSLGMMKRMRLVVSMRLHALIFAASVGAPLVAVSYDPKVGGFMRYIGQARCIELDSLTPQALKDLCAQALQEETRSDVEALRRLAAENETIAAQMMEETK